MPDDAGKPPTEPPTKSPDDGGDDPSAPVPGPQSLPPGVQRIIEGAEQRRREGRHAQLGVHHWLLEVIGRHGAMAEGLAKGLEATSLQKHLYEQVRGGNVGAPLDADALLRQATERARARGKDTPAERDLAAAILQAAGYELVEGGSNVVMTTNPASTANTAPGKAPEAEQAPSGYQSRMTRPTPTLEQYGRDLTKLAWEGKLPPVIGRAEEVQLVMETLCRRTKRNPVLVGPAGVGKTAIVEGLAQRIVRGEVPDELKGVRLFALQPSILVAGASVVGELEKRMKAILQEAAQNGITLFIDEVHSMIGAGGMPGTGDVASLLKPALARGDLAVIAATTDDEYRRFIEQDSALERRFQPVRVQELSPAQTLEVLKVLRDDLGKLRNVEVSDAVLENLISFAGQFMRNRYFPDKAVDLLEQVIAYAITQNRRSVTEADATTVVQRMVGMPLALEDRLEALGNSLRERALLRDEDIEALTARLNVTMRGLDLRVSRPNAVLLALGAVAESSEALSETLSRDLFGADDRVVAIDFSRFVHPADVTSLVGAPPGYIGYSDSLPLHRVAQMPWCVLRCENIDMCHPQVLEVLTQSLADGFFSEARGKRIYLSDCVVLLTAGIQGSAIRSIGFRAESASSTNQAGRRRAVEGALGDRLADQVDLVVSEPPRAGDAQRKWLERNVLAELSDRFSKVGVTLRWDESLIGWLVEQQNDYAEKRDWERLVDEKLSPVLVRHLPEPGSVQKTLSVKWDGNNIQVETSQEAEG
jgi:ATP-dependent Clp protease ATP-binding subunit ClpC